MKNTDSNSNLRAYGANAKAQAVLLLLLLALAGSSVAQAQQLRGDEAGFVRAVPKGREPIVQPIEGPAPERSPAPARAQTSSGSALLDALLGMLGAK